MSTKFSSKLSTILVAAGCSVGLGNIWRFPYVAGANGGGAFLLIYLVSIIIIGIPVMLSEFSMGRATHKSAVGAYKELGGRWHWLGLNGVLAATIIMGFYYVVAGWTTEYFAMSVSGRLADFSSASQLKDLFGAIVSNPWQPLVFTLGFILVNHLIITMGVAAGLERVSKVLMPLLFFILIGLAINSLLLPNSLEGVVFFLKPDFSKITPAVILEAVGQSFFSLSIGLGALIAYGSYIREETNLRSAALVIVALDTAVALLAGFIIFPATTSLGIDPTAGPALVFETLPAIFQALPMSMFLSTVFFVLLMIAALTSTMSLHEVLTVYLMEEWGCSRKKGTTITTLIVAVLGTVASLSFSVLSGVKLFDLNMFDFMDYLTANYMLPIGGLLTCIFVGWMLDRDVFEEQITNKGKLGGSIVPVMIFLLKYVCPIVLFIVFLNSIGIFKF
ncbi:MAG: sodium-dependent transporter [Rikenellaceae bacterium]